MIRPSQAIKVHIVERNPDTLQEVYELGIKDCKEVLEKLNNYLEQQ